MTESLRPGEPTRAGTPGLEGVAGSADPTGDAFAPGTEDALGNVLLVLARQAIARSLNVAVGEPPVPTPDVADLLQRPGATFVTLTQGGVLRGCIGSLEARDPLVDDVQRNACAAAFQDPRFAALTVEELPETDVEVSLLSAPEPLAFTTEEDLLTQLRPGVDGLILSAEGRRGTFLPQVWEQLPVPGDFWTHLKRKAGLPASWWDDRARVYRYRVTAWEEGHGKR